MSPEADADLARLLAGLHYARWLGMTARREGATVLAVLPFTPKLVGNPVLPALHGGVVGAFLEFSALVHLAATQGLSRPPKPIGVSIDFLRSGRPEPTYAAAEIRRLGRRVANVRAEAWQADRGAPIAALHGHFLLPAAAGEEDEA